MKIGYVRVSESDPEDFLNFQMQHLREYGCSDKNIFIERRSGVAGHRPAYNALVDTVGLGDEVVVWSLDRIGRSVEHIAEFVTELKNKGAYLRTIGEGAENIDTNPMSNTQHHRLFDLFARFRSMIDKERAKHNSKRRNPNRGETASLLMNWDQVSHAQRVMASREYPVATLCRELGVSPPTLYEYVGPSGELRERGLRVKRLFGPKDEVSDPDAAGDANA